MLNLSTSCKDTHLATFPRDYSCIVVFGIGTCPFRNPEADERPAFVDIMIPLQKPDFQILKWSEDDFASSSAASRTLGAPLEAGLALHRDLQRTYLTAAKPHSRKDSKTAEKAGGEEKELFQEDEDGYI